ncbi:MAG: sulfur carrier protein ThiS [Candidatus Brocadiia bacterium]
MHITVNGEKKELAEGLTVRGLLEKSGIVTNQVAVEVNLQIIPKTDFDKYVIKQDDKVEIISFVGGG